MAASLALFAWLLDAVRPTSTDLLGAAIALVGMGVIMLGPMLNR